VVPELLNFLFRLAFEGRAVGFLQLILVPNCTISRLKRYNWPLKRDTGQKRGERWQAARIVPIANCRTFIRAFIAAAFLGEKNLTVRALPPEFIPAQNAAKMDRSISSFKS
jgi:hypothetical protein